MALFDPKNYISSLYTPTSLKSMAIKSIPSVSSLIGGGLVDKLSKTGVSLSGLQTLTATKIDSFTLGDPSYRNITQQDLFSARSNSQSDPTQISSSTSQETVIFPPNLGDDYLRIAFSKYDRPSALMPAKFHTEYAVHLPLPKMLSETHSVSILPQSTGQLGMMTDQIKSIINSTQGNSGNGTTDDALGLLYGGIGRTATQAVAGVVGVNGEQAFGTVGQFLKAIPNPHISVFFNGVDIRQPMEFSWLFTAKNESESKQIKHIIKQFKKRVLPQVSASAQNIMAYPNMVKLTLHPWAEQFPSTGAESNLSATMPVYKMGLISAIHVDYSPLGLSFFNDEISSPTFIVFSFTFQEIEIITADDYKDSQDESFSPSDAIKSGINNLTSANISEIFKTK